MVAQGTVLACDVGNVIITADQNITSRLLMALGVDERNAETFFSNKEYAAFSRGRIRSDEFCQALTNDYLKVQLPCDTLRDAHDKHITGVDWDVLAVLDKIRGIPLIFLTNTNVWQTERERELVDLTKYSGTIIRSHEIHALKIDGDYYSILEKTTGLRPDRLILIDDNLQIIERAKQHGLRTIQFTSAKQLLASLQKLI